MDEWEIEAGSTEPEHGKNLHERIVKLQAKARGMGAGDPDFDLKKFTDEGWDGPKGNFSRTDIDLA